MSTNYYLINKNDKKIKQDLDILLETEINKFKNALISFGKINKLSDSNSHYSEYYEDNIEDKIRDVKSYLEHGLFKPQEIHICKTGFNRLTWQVNKYFKDLITFQRFYDDNKDLYYIKDEYSQEFSSDEFLKEILWDGHLWNPSYFVATVSENTEEQIRNYIKSQKEK